MSRFSTFCWFAVVLCLFSVGQSPWLSSGGLGMGRASAGEMEDIGQDEPHIGGSRSSGGSIDANQTGGISSGTVNTTGSGTVDLTLVGGSSFGASGGSFSSGLSFNIEVIDLGYTGTSNSVDVGNIEVSIALLDEAFADALRKTGLSTKSGDGDGIVDSADNAIWANAFGSTEGFIDTGGSVSGADYTTWANNFGTTGGFWANNFGSDLTSLTLPAAVSSVSVMMDAAAYTDWANNYGQSGDGVPGDFNGDGVVDMLDNLEWGDHFGEFFSPPLAAAAVAARGASLTAMSVPEPSGLLLMALGLSSLILCRARRLLPSGLHSTPE